LRLWSHWRLRVAEGRAQRAAYSIMMTRTKSMGRGKIERWLRMLIVHRDYSPFV